MGQYQNRPNPMASRLAALCFNRENEEVDNIIEFMRDQLGQFNVSVLMFDGFVANIPLAAREATDTAIIRYNEEASVRVAIKAWPTQVL